MQDISCKEGKVRLRDITTQESKILCINLDFLDEFEYRDDLRMRHFYEDLLKKAFQLARKMNGVLIPRGSFVTSMNELCIENELTYAQARNTLKKLKDSNYITTKIIRKKLYITVSNYELATTGGQESNRTEHTGIAPINSKTNHRISKL